MEFSNYTLNPKFLPSPYIIATYIFYTELIHKMLRNASFLKLFGVSTLKIDIKKKNKVNHLTIFFFKN